jgi:GTPase
MEEEVLESKVKSRSYSLKLDDLTPFETETTDKDTHFNDQKLPKEVEEGNIEYKLKLIAPTAERFEHLVSQCKWRLTEGCGEAIYEVGVEDDGTPSGLTPEEMEASLETLRNVGKRLGADVTVIRTRDGIDGPTRKVCEVLVRRFASEEFFEIRVAVVGNVDSGKSTLLGVLTRGQLDNGRGLARMNVFVHKHEIETGRTSSISHEVLGFDSKGNVVTNNAVRPLTQSEICEASSKLVTFIDLAGHEKYLKTTVFGLTGHAPDFAMLMVGGNMGVVGMTKEHLGIALALRVPVFVVVTKIDMAPPNILKETITQLEKVLKSPGCRKLPIHVRNIDDVVVCAKNFVSERICPIFMVSNVTGENLDLLRAFLNLLPGRTDWEELRRKPSEFHIDATWTVSGVGTVVSGTVMSGSISINQTYLLGPDEFGKFTPVNVKSIHSKRVPVRTAKAGHTAGIALKKIARSAIRKGMVLVDPSLKPTACREFEAEILVLFHSTTISTNYQAVVHCGVAQQTAKLINLDREYLRTGDKGKIRFRFLYWPEYVREGSRLIFREGRTKGIGRITRIIPKEEEIGNVPTVKQKKREKEVIVITKRDTDETLPPAEKTNPLTSSQTVKKEFTTETTIKTEVKNQSRKNHKRS